MSCLMLWFNDEHMHVYRSILREVTTTRPFEQISSTALEAKANDRAPRRTLHRSMRNETAVRQPDCWLECMQATPHESSKGE
jgi:hypothetical protein